MNVAVHEDFEFELRCLSGVVNVGFSGGDEGAEQKLTVVARRQDLEAVRTEARLLSSLFAPDLQIEVTSAVEPAHESLDPIGTGQVTLLKAEFSHLDGCAEVTVTHAGVMGTARSNSGPLIGGAEATLAALRGLGLDLPVYLLGVTKVDTAPGSPVIVTLRSLGTDEDHVGVAQTGDDVRSSVAATLDALSRCVGLRT